MSFSTGGLFHRESIQLAELYRSFSEWEAVRAAVIDENLLQTRTLSTSQRVSREIISRLKTLSDSELDFLIEASHSEQAQLLWVVVCRSYRLIAEFAIEVLRERFITLKQDLSYEDFDSFFNHKAEWCEQLEQISASTRKKLRQVLFRMMREADLITPGNMINATRLSPGMVDLLSATDRHELLYFPSFEADMK
jgi:hypothetical protein